MLNIVRSDFLKRDRNLIQVNIIFLQDDEAKAVKYAALDFSTRRVIKGKKNDLLEECLYSVVRADAQNQ